MQSDEQDEEEAGEDSSEADAEDSPPVRFC